MSTFDSDKKHLTYLLDQIDQRDLALPDFQRDFVWKPAATAELVRSVMRSFPAGTVLLLQGGGKHFKPRAFAHAPELNGQEPTYLALDGQQRLTSLSSAFRGRGEYLYFLNIKDLLAGESLDEALEFWKRSRIKKWATITGQAADLAMPLDRLMDFANWKDEVIEQREMTDSDTDVKKLKKDLNAIQESWVTPVLQYQFPVTTLNSSTSLEAVCTIFETLNSTGVKLSVFDLLVARGYKQNVELRSMNEAARNAYPLLDEFRIDPYYALQVIATWTTGSPVRSKVLGLDVKKDVEPNWDEACRYLDAALRMLQTECGILVEKYVPYGTMLITMAAAWPEIAAAKGPEVGARREKLRRWFWCATFDRRYATQSNTRTQNDVPDIRSWLGGGGSAPSVTTTGTVPDLRTISANTDALYGAVLALSLRNHPLDFHHGQPLTAERIRTDDIDDHHVFPAAYLDKTHGTPKSERDCILNRTLIDRTTNIRILAKAPSAYLGDMVKTLGAGSLKTVLESHTLPSAEGGPLFSDDFDGFRAWREDQLVAAIHEVTGWPAAAPTE